MKRKSLSRSKSQN